MSRIRTIKPEFGQHDRLSTLPAEAHLIAALLLPYADDEGYFNANPKLVHATICPLRELLQSVPVILASLRGVGYIELFIGTDGREYGHIVNFLDHQRVSHPSPSKIKALRKIPEDARSVPESFRPEGNRIEREVEVEGIPETPPEQHPLNHARRMIQVLGLSERIIRSVEAGLMAEVQLTGNGLEETAQYITNWCMTKRTQGVVIDRFTFDDTKWRNGNGTKRQTGAVEQRVNGNREVLADIAREIVTERVGPDSHKRESGTGAADRKRISASVG